MVALKKWLPAPGLLQTAQIKIQVLGSLMLAFDCLGLLGVV